MMDNPGRCHECHYAGGLCAGEGREFQKWNTATNAEKAELAMQMFFDRTSQYAGNFARESEDTLSGSMGAVKAAFSNVPREPDTGEKDWALFTGTGADCDNISCGEPYPRGVEYSALAGGRCDLYSDCSSAIGDGLSAISSAAAGRADCRGPQLLQRERVAEPACKRDFLRRCRIFFRRDILP